jgi:hypothetical protein
MLIQNFIMYTCGSSGIYELKSIFKQYYFVSFFFLPEMLLFSLKTLFHECKINARHRGTCKIWSPDLT